MMTKISSISLSLLFLFGCSNPESVSHSKEQIDAANNLLNRYGLASMPTYDEILKYPSVMLKNADGSQRFPWIDTYWPTGEKNLARRWGHIIDATEANRDNGSDYRLASYFKTQIEALKAQELSVNLAPSEKFDILYRSKKGLSLSEDNANLLDLTQVEAKQTAAIPDDLDMGAILTMNRGWARDYTQALQSSENAWNESALQKIAPLTSEGMVRWLANSAQDGNLFPGIESEGADWSWEGICHGWAPAAVYSEEPKHAVKVEFPVGGSKKSMLLTEGDIRGLMSKVWADANNDETFFIGRRCEKDLADADSRGPSNDLGRGVSGTLKYSKDGQETSSLFTIVQDYPRAQGSSSLMRIILESEWKDGHPQYAYLIARNSRNRFPSYRLVFDEGQAFAEVESNEVAPSGLATYGVEIFGCWDVNPASFHTLLIENIGKKNLGFVMDRTQSAQVWNQPIGAANFSIGDLKNVADLGNRDATRFYRAPGTVFIAEVTAKVSWGSEPSSPRFTYSANGDMDQIYTQQSTYTYTLEFDADKRLIGGEWGRLGEMKPAMQNPDFLFGFAQKVEPNLQGKAFMQEGYDMIIKKIHACSLQDNVDGEVALVQKAGRETFEDKIKFVNCSLD